MREHPRSRRAPGVILIVLLVIAAFNSVLVVRRGQHRQESPATAPAASPSEDLAPSEPLELGGLKVEPGVYDARKDRDYIHTFKLNLWEIRTREVRLDFRGTVQSKKGGTGTFCPQSMEAPPDFVPRDLAVDGEVVYVGGDYVTMKTPFGVRRAFFPVLRPKSRIPQGGNCLFGLSFTVGSLNHLHVLGPRRRNLSIRMERLDGDPPTNFIIAIPEKSKVFSFTDAQPYKRKEYPGWRVFFYRLCETARYEMIHIDFQLGPEPKVELRRGAVYSEVVDALR